MPQPRLSARLAEVRSSPVRDILSLTERPEVISFAGGLLAPELFPVEMLAERHLRMFEQVFVVLAMHGERGERGEQGRGQEKTRQAELAAISDHNHAGRKRQRNDDFGGTVMQIVMVDGKAQAKARALGLWSQFPSPSHGADATGRSEAQPAVFP